MIPSKSFLPDKGNWEPDGRFALGSEQVRMLAFILYRGHTKDGREDGTFHIADLSKEFRNKHAALRVFRLLHERGVLRQKSEHLFTVSPLLKQLITSNSWTRLQFQMTFFGKKKC